MLSIAFYKVVAIVADDGGDSIGIKGQQQHAQDTRTSINPYGDAVGQPGYHLNPSNALREP